MECVYCLHFQYFTQSQNLSCTFYCSIHKKSIHTHQSKQVHNYLCIRLVVRQYPVCLTQNVFCHVYVSLGLMCHVHGIISSIEFHVIHMQSVQLDACRWMRTSYTHKNKFDVTILRKITRERERAKKKDVPTLNTFTAIPYGKWIFSMIYNITMNTHTK